MRHFLSTEKFMHLPEFGFSGRTSTDTTRMPKPRLVAATSVADKAKESLAKGTLWQHRHYCPTAVATRRASQGVPSECDRA
jgi:hypothetical protein